MYAADYRPSIGSKYAYGIPYSVKPGLMAPPRQEMVESIPSYGEQLQYPENSSVAVYPSDDQPRSDAYAPAPTDYPRRIEPEMPNDVLHQDRASLGIHVGAKTERFVGDSNAVQVVFLAILLLYLLSVTFRDFFAELPEAVKYGAVVAAACLAIYII